MRGIFWRHRGLAGTVALLVVLGVPSCEEFVGVEPPEDALHFPTGMALHPDGRYLYVVNSNFDVAFSAERGGTVTVIDTDTLAILPESTVRIGSFGGQVALSDDARYLYVAVRGDNSVVRLAVSEDGRDLTCNGRRDGLPCRFEGLRSDPFAVISQRFNADLEVGGSLTVDLLTVTHLRTNDITAISFLEEDPASEARVSVELTAGGSALAVHPRTGNTYAVGRADDRVRILRPIIGREGRVVAISSLGNIPLIHPGQNYDARDIAFTSDGDRAFVTVRNPHSVLVLDTSPNLDGTGARNAWIATVDLNEPPERLVVVTEGDDEVVYVLELGAKSVTAIDPVNAVVLDRFAVGNGPAAMAVDSERHQRMYVSLFGERAVAVVDLDPESRRFRTTVAKVR